MPRENADQEIYPFADLTLAQRLEQSEALANVDFVTGRALAFPESGAVLDFKSEISDLRSAILRSSLQI